MPRMALGSATKGRLWPSFFFLCLAGHVLAQQAIYRCGHEYTNAPADESRCERMAPQAVTVIPGTRVQGPPPAAPAAMPPAASVAATSASVGASTGAVQQRRDELARGILQAELEQARQRHQQLVQEYRGGEPLRTGEEARSPGQHEERVARLKAAIERSQRDMDSLQRELARRPAATTPP